MSTEERWKLRFSNFEKAFIKLISAVDRVKDNDDELLQAGLIQTYEFTFELAWKTLKDYLEEQGFDTPSPKATLRQAFQSEYVKDGELWLKALDDRNKTAHIYNEEMAREVVSDICEKYFFLLRDLCFELKKEI